MILLPRPDNFRYLNREGRWLDFQWSGLSLTSSGGLELAATPMLAGTPPDLSALAAPDAPAGIAADASGQVFWSAPADNQIFVMGGCHNTPSPLSCITESEHLAPLNEPRGLCLIQNPPRLVVVDSGNHRVLFLDAESLVLRDVWGQPDLAATPVPGDEPGRFNAPWDVAVDADGLLYILDFGNQRVQRFRPTGEPDLSFAANLQAGALLTAPVALAVSGSGDGLRIFIVDRAVNKLFVFDRQGQAINGSDGTPLVLPCPAGVVALAADSSTVYIGDNQSRSILTCTSDTLSPSGTALGFIGPVSALALSPSGALLVLPGGSATPPLTLDVSGGYVATGTLWSNAIAAGTAAVSWSRLSATLTTADAAHIRFFYALANSITPPPVASSTPDPFSDAAWKVLPVDVDDFLLSGASARYLFLGATFHSDRTATPRLEQLRASFNDPGYLAHLPPLYRNSAPETFLTPLLALLKSLFDDIEHEIDTLPLFFNAKAAPESTLPWLASWLAVDLELGEPVDQIRRAISTAFARDAWRGTAEGLRLALLYDAGVHANIIEPIQSLSIWSFPGDVSCSGSSATPTGVVLSSNSGLSDMQPGGPVLGSTAQLDRSDFVQDDQYGTPLFDGAAHQFIVEVSSAEAATPAHVALIREIVEREKPAHTIWQLSIFEASMSVGAQARIGIDSIVAGLAAPTGLGEEATRGGIHLAGTPAPRVGSSRLGNNFKLTQ